jgi:hypothetical protein
MHAIRRRVVTSSWLRFVRGLLLALLSGVAALAPLALAAEPSTRDRLDPDVRLRLFIRKITVHDD